jgi:ATP-dependent DNA helicase RecG
MSILIGIADLLSTKKVESTRIEFKSSWNPKAVLRTICAFANDFENEGSGYIVIGVSENNGFPLRPVMGYDPVNYDKDCREILNYCHQIQPSYIPRLSLEEIDEKQVLVIWCPAGANRPYQVPDDVTARQRNYNFRIRFEANTIIPNEEQARELIQLTAKIPFDDRINHDATVHDLSKNLMQEHLLETNSKLYAESEHMLVEELAEKMNLCQGAKEHLFPKNVGLLMFSKKTQTFFKGAVIDLVEFPSGLTGGFTEKTFGGPIQKQLIDVLAYLKTYILKTMVVKHPDTEKADRIQNYPYDALEEAIANAVYHRNYEIQDPIEIRVLPSAIEIISYNGADPSLKQSDFDAGRVRARRYRNRRVGEFLKELKLTEGRGTGIPTIIATLKSNGSPLPLFDTNEPQRTHFLIELPIHKAFITAASDQDTDQDADQDTNLIISELEFLDTYVCNSTEAFSDQDTDQVEKEEMNKRLIHISDALLNHLKELVFGGNTTRINDRIYQKYKSSALHLSAEAIQLLKQARYPISNKELQEKALGLKAHHDNFKVHISPLLQKEYLTQTIKDKPTSKYQKYIITAKGKRVLSVYDQLNSKHLK